MRLAEYIAAIAVAVLGVAAIGLARQLPYRAEFGVGPGFFPLWLGVVLVILSAVLVRSIWQADRQPATPSEPATDEPAPNQIIPAAEARKPWLIFLISTAAVVLLFSYLGMVISMGLFMLVTVRWVAGRSWRASLAYAVLSPIAFYIAFGVLLSVPLPVGPFGF